LAASKPGGDACGAQLARRRFAGLLHAGVLISQPHAIHILKIDYGVAFC